MNISTLIVEDDGVFSTMLQMLLRKHKDFQLLEVVEDKKSAIEAIKKHKPDLIFMDIYLKSGSGMDVLEACKDDYSFVIFVTSFDEFALKGYEYRAIHYLLKPFEESSFIKAITSARTFFMDKKQLSKINQNIAHYTGNGNSDDGKIFIPYKGSLQAIRVESILYIESDKSYTDVHTLAQVYKLSKNLSQMHRELANFSQFVRIHRSFLININHIVNIKRGLNSLVYLTNGVALPISNNEKKDFFQKLGIVDEE